MQLEFELGPNLTWETFKKPNNERNEHGPIAVDLFSGPGGMSLGFKWAGYKVAAAVELDPHVAMTYRKNHPGTEVLEKSAKDVTADEIHEICGTPDIVIGGPPCQGFSWANTQTRSVHHPGSAASWHFVRLIEEIQPKAFVMENVDGFTRIDGGNVLDQFMARFEQVGYSVHHIRLNSERFGVPQRRDRVFFVGTHSQTAITPSPVSVKHTVRDAISDLPSIPPGSRGLEPTDYGGPAASDYQAWARAGSKTLHNHVTTQSKEYMVQRFRHVPEGGNWRSIPEDLMSNYADLSNVHSLIYRRLKWNDRATTVTNVRKSVTIHPRDHRIISVREAARLQSFPDTYRFHGGLMHAQQQVADAVPPLMAKAVGECVFSIVES